MDDLTGATAHHSVRSKTCKQCCTESRTKDSDDTLSVGLLMSSSMKLLYHLPKFSPFSKAWILLVVLCSATNKD